MPEPRRWLGPLALAALLVMPAGRAGAQAVLTVSDLRRQFCVSFLAEPAEAIRQVGSRYRPVVAGEAPDLMPALRMLIDGEPEYATWVPGRVCVVEAGAVSSGPAAAAPGTRSVVFGWMALQAREDRAGADGDAPTWRALGFFSPDGALRRQVRDYLVHMDGADWERGLAVGSTDERIRLNTGGTTLVWEGRETGTATPTPARPGILFVNGRRSDQWAANLGLAPLTERPLVGSLQVRGKSYLAEALKASPIRMVEPIRAGGGGTIEFTPR